MSERCSRNIADTVHACSYAFVPSVGLFTCLIYAHVHDMWTTRGATPTHASMSIRAIYAPVWTALLCARVPYYTGVLEDSHLSGSEELFEAVGEMIMDSVPGCTEEDTLEFCTRLFRIITGFVSYYVTSHPALHT